jgi:hypothetical protein
MVSAVPRYALRSPFTGTFPARATRVYPDVSIRRFTSGFYTISSMHRRSPRDVSKQRITRLAAAGISATCILSRGHKTRIQTEDKITVVVGMHRVFTVETVQSKPYSRNRIVAAFLDPFACATYHSALAVIPRSRRESTDTYSQSCVHTSSRE